MEMQEPDFYHKRTSITCAQMEQMYQCGWELQCKTCQFSKINQCIESCHGFS